MSLALLDRATIAAYGLDRAIRFFWGFIPRHTVLIRPKVTILGELRAVDASVRMLAGRWYHSSALPEASGRRVFPAL